MGKFILLFVLGLLLFSITIKYAKILDNRIGLFEGDTSIVLTVIFISVLSSVACTLLLQ